jgi:hypothetical protein
MSVDASTPATRAANAVTGAIRNAAQVTGTSFRYLLATARIESDLDPSLTMRSSSATGLFQFIDQTWLSTLKQAGPGFGYSRYADAITRTSSGRYVVQDPALRDDIMRLRKDPTANAVMAGVFTQQNASVLGNRLGRTPSDGELYMAHFLGPSGAAKLIGLTGSNPQASAAEVFPQAARVNRPIFYDQQGNARSVAGVYAELANRYQVAAGPASSVAMASTTVPVRRPAAAAPPAAVDTAGMTTAFAAVSAPASTTETTGPVFHSLFQTGERRGAVAPLVAELWTTPKEPRTAGPSETSGVGSTLGLFRDKP